VHVCFTLVESGYICTLFRVSCTAVHLCSKALHNSEVPALVKFDAERR